MVAENVQRIYQEAGFQGVLEPGTRPAVLVVDFSRGFTDPASRLGSDMGREVQLTRRLLERARPLGIPILFTTIAYDATLSDAGIWVRKVPSMGDLRAGSRWVEIDPRLGRQAEEPLIVKRFASAFFGTHLASLLAARQVDTLLVGGATTSGCVRASVVDAMQYGYPTFVVRECVADRAKGPHEANLFDMSAKYAEVLSLDETLAYLEGLGTKTGQQAEPAIEDV